MSAESTGSAAVTNNSSRRGASRKVRVYIFREWLLKIYGNYLSEQQGLAFGINPDESEHQSIERGGRERAAKKRKRARSVGNECIVLDVAGGKGDLSWLLKNVDGLESIVVDPWKPDPGTKSRNERMAKSVEYLRSHPEEAQKRSVPFLPTYQPLAGLMPQLMEERRKRLLARLKQTHNSSANSTSSSSLLSKPTDAVSEAGSNDSLDGSDSLCCRPEDFLTPRLLQVPLDDKLVQQVQDQMLAKRNRASGALKHERPLDVKEQRVEESEIRNSYSYSNSRECIEDESVHQAGDDDVIDILSSGRIKLIMGFHPDQATEPCIDLARVLDIPFCIVPCCVFPSEFPDRRLRLKDAHSSEGGTNEHGGAKDCDGGQLQETKMIPVRTYHQFLEYLRQKATNKHSRIYTAHLDFPFTETAKNIVLYTLPPSPPTYTGVV
eukprot:CAMPEP_0172411456 /NCGR_PEP_ID=MMETSP1061-20121228/77401_1 /TAXON_ID=37318 /ORGANISM="Pseudo-nitzschia pungens, Strain cf. pungens" /LENGTH=435 /DNA_ID=CAMNT_0013147665 /DNA_START=91 /DNA_END=1398 /DNA_ORIENTATION=+